MAQQVNPHIQNLSHSIITKSLITSSFPAPAEIITHVENVFTDASRKQKAFAYKERKKWISENEKANSFQIPPVLITLHSS